MFDQLLLGVMFNLDELVVREEEDEVIQARKILPLLTSRCKLTANVLPQEPLVEWMNTIYVLFHTTIVLKPFSPMKISFIAC